MTGAFTITLVCFLGFHMYLVFANKTTLEAGDNGEPNMVISIYLSIAKLIHSSAARSTISAAEPTSSRCLAAIPYCGSFQ